MKLIKRILAAFVVLAALLVAFFNYHLQTHAVVTTEEVVPSGEQTHIEMAAKQAEGIVEGLKTTYAARGVHAKGHACVKAYIDVLPDINQQLQHGVFANPGHEYKAWIRFSNSGSNMAKADDHAKDARGMAIKLLNAGENVNGGTTQEFIAHNSPAFFVTTVEDYNQFVATKGDPMYFVQGYNPFKWRVRELWQLVTAYAEPPISPLWTEYFSNTAYKLGPHNVKFKMQACGAQPAKELSEGDACMQLAVQLQDTSKQMPIEDATVLWKEGDSPFMPVADITILEQKFDTPAQQQFCENLSFSPWNALADHRPIGALNRARKFVYDASANYRHKQLPNCLLADRFPLRKRLYKARDLLKQNKPTDKALKELEAKVQTSTARLQQRIAQLPKPNYPDELPVSARKAEIAKAITENQVVIVCGETGSGKTTQLPKICLELGRGAAGLIGHTQPRRIAARSVATRIAQELDSELGKAVGYKVRFNEKSSASSYIKLMTDGILLAETQGDKFLNDYDTIIIDEAHERSLNIDFLLGYLKQLLPKRRDLKVIVTSATIDAERFSKHFDGAPVIEVSGRTYPVDIRYRPLGKAGFRSAETTTPDNAQFEEGDETVFGIARKGKTEARWLEEDDEEEAIEEAILDAADDLLRQEDGDILVFLPGEREIRDVADHLRKYQGRSQKLKHIDVLPLFARLSIADQQKIFKPHGSRRIVLATNVAETSLTVPGIKYVIDAGLARINRYSPRAKVEQLQIEKISQAAAKQRAGRCGRVSNGICVRLYSEEDFNKRSEFTDPEIIRSSLSSVILRMAALRLGDVDAFPFIEAPSSRLIADGYAQLQELGAVNQQRQITEIGVCKTHASDQWISAKLPIMHMPSLLVKVQIL